MTLLEKIKRGLGDTPRWLPAEGGQEVAVVVIEHDEQLPCGCDSWRKNEPHPGFPLREHYGAATEGLSQFTILVFKDGRAIHFACGATAGRVEL